jgi:tRNA A-37 threonylcarbamoyl transferase component Bud32
VDRDVAQLVREQRLLEAARMAGDRGDARTASSIYEQACEWRSAAVEAMRAGDGLRALDLALYAGDEATAQQALALVIRDGATAEAAAGRLTHRGRHAWAARVLEGCGRIDDAARSWERAGEAVRAASLLESSGDGANAMRVLQAALLSDPNAWEVTIALGVLLGRFGEWEAAVRLLQRVPADAPQRGEALAALVRALERLGLARAASEAAAALELLGGTTTSTGASEEPRPVHDTLLFGRYELVRQVASSPSARVLECMDVVRGERVAVKLFAACDAQGGGRDAFSRFEREMRAMKAAQHPSVVQLYDFLSEGPAMVLAWMSGGTLEHMLSESMVVAPARAVEIAWAVLSALGAAHRLGIVHRGVKPANVLFDEGGGARLSDFGVAHLSDVSTTATAGSFGSIAYMSPEQRSGRPATPVSDVFAVGVMLREMLTGERPSTEDFPRVLPSERHRGLDARHDAAVARMTALDADARPADAFEASGMLASIPWPGTVDATAARTPASHGPSATMSEGRLSLMADGRLVDLWTDRTIEQTPLTERSLARARAFARADRAALQTVYRVDEATRTIWLEGLEGELLNRALRPKEIERLRNALDALHAAGAVYGSIERQNVVETPEGPVLRFAGNADASATVDRDKVALATL